MEGSLVAYKVFTNGSVLNASEINDNLMNQSVMVFSNSTARSAALTSPLAGMVTFLEDTSAYESYDGAAWIGFGGGGKILQVVSVPKTDTFTLTSTTMTDITGLSASITPSSTSSKVFVVLTFGQIDGSTDVIISGDVTRNGTAIGIGDAAGTRTRTGWSVVTDTGNRGHSASFTFLDSPSTTSSLTYQARIRSRDSSLYLNRSFSDTDGVFARTISTITLMEVAG
jgi:hypothetical protein